jgi:lysine-specific demethylase 8
MYENIERIKAPSREVFFNEYLLKQKPVIITNLFEGQPISEISSLDVARKLLGDMPVLIQEGFETYLTRMLQMSVSGEFTNADLEKERSTVNGYLALVEKDPKTRKVCAEVPRDMIGAVESRYKIPEYCRPEPGEPDEYVSMLWLGNAGNHTHMHYDADYRNIFQYQLWGEKRAVLVPPQQAKKLLPLGNNSALSPEQLSESETDAFVKYVGGYQAVVRTGETLFMPALIWHYFEYMDTSMALTMRFHRNKYIRFLADKLHTDYRKQAIAWKYMNDRALTPELLEAYAEIEREYQKPFDNPVEKGVHMQHVYERIYGRICQDSVKGEWSRPFLEVLRDIYRNTEVIAGGLYPEPEAAQVKAG